MCASKSTVSSSIGPTPARPRSRPALAVRSRRTRGRKAPLPGSPPAVLIASRPRSTTSIAHLADVNRNNNKLTTLLRYVVEVCGGLCPGLNHLLLTIVSGTLSAVHRAISLRRPRRRPDPRSSSSDSLGATCMGRPPPAWAHRCRWRSTNRRHSCTAARDRKPGRAVPPLHRRTLGRSTLQDLPMRSRSRQSCFSMHAPPSWTKGSTSLRHVGVFTPSSKGVNMPVPIAASDVVNRCSAGAD